MIQEVTDSLRITAPETPFAPSSLQELVGDWLMQLGECQVSPLEPPCEVAQQPPALSHGRVGITQFLRVATNESRRGANGFLRGVLCCRVWKTLLSMCPLISG